MSAAADLFTVAALPAVTNPPPPDFRTVFLNHLAQHAHATASYVRDKHRIPGNNDVGATVRGLCREGLITADGFDIATGLTGKGRLTRLWKLTTKGRAAFEVSEAAK